jgi:[acyl-carrier-protein] S-malonyltransferase
MGKLLYDTSSAAREVFDSAGQILGFDLKEICFAGPEDRLNQTDISQPAIYVTGVASHRHAVESGLFDAAAVTAFAGLSLGEYTALHLAGVFEFEDGLRLVAQRGKYMQEAAVASPSGMVALIGADEPTVANFCQQSAAGEVLVAANYNSPGQIVVSGTLSACERLVKVAESAGVRGTVLKVAGAFHSPLMQSAADKMRDELARVSFAPPQKPVYSNVTAQPHGDGESTKELLVQQIVSPVRWAQTMQILVTADEQGRYVELAPGRTLAGLAKRISRRLRLESLGATEKSAGERSAGEKSVGEKSTGTVA